MKEVTFYKLSAKEIEQIYSIATVMVCDNEEYIYVPVVLKRMYGKFDLFEAINIEDLDEEAKKIVTVHLEK